MDPYDDLPRRRRTLCSLDPVPACWQPAVDVYRVRGGWVCKFDLAGVGKDDELEVRAQGCVLLVSGVRRDRYVADGLRTHSLEIAYNRFERAVELPCDLARADIGLEFQDGMLVVLVKMPEGEP